MAGVLVNAFTVEQASRFYRIEPIDYGHEREGDWLLLGAGTGLMMSCMDLIPEHRYCIDTDVLSAAEWDRLPSWLTLMEGAVTRINACGWFSRYENGLKMIGALSVLKRRPCVYFGPYEKPELLASFEQLGSLSSFVRRLRFSTH